MYLLTEWETESQTFSRPARPHSVKKHFITWSLCFWIYWQSEPAWIITLFWQGRTRFFGPITWHVRPSYVTFQRNCARGRTDHVIISLTTAFKQQIPKKKNTLNTSVLSNSHIFVFHSQTWTSFHSISFWLPDIYRPSTGCSNVG